MWYTYTVKYFSGMREKERRWVFMDFAKNEGS